IEEAKPVVSNEEVSPFELVSMVEKRKPEKTPEQPFTLNDTPSQPTIREGTPAAIPQNPAAAEQFCQQAAEDFYQGNYWSTVQNCKRALELKQDFRIYHLMGKALAKHQG